MKFRNILLNVTVGLAALLFGIAWVGVYNYFLGTSHAPGQNCFAEMSKIENAKQIDFDINDPNSVLPIDFEEDKLSDPKSDENNAEYFDPEGTYYVIDDLPSEFGSFESFTITNKTLKYDETGSYTVEDVAPEGYVFDDKKHEFETLEIKDGKINFKTKETKTGVTFNFEGKFLVKGNFYTLDENAEVVRGTLTKVNKDGRTVLHNFTFGWMIDFE